MQGDESTERLLRVMASLRLPVPPKALRDCGLADAQTMDAVRASGALVLNRDGHLIVNPLQVLRLPPCDDAALRVRLLSAALNRVPHRVDLQIELVRAVAPDDLPRARLLAARVCRQARTAGSTRDLVTLLMDRSLVALFLELSRRDLLCCFIEAGWPDSVLAVLQSDERAIRGMVACWQRRFSDAIQDVAGLQTADAELVRARAHLLSGDLDAADAAFEAFDGYESSFSQTLEVWLLRHRRAVLVQDAAGRDRAAQTLESLAARDGDPYLAAHVESGLIRAAMFGGDMPTAERHLSELKSMAEATSSPSIQSMIQYSEALIGTLKGNHARLAAAVQGDPGDVLSPGYARWKTLSALEHALRGEVRTALEIMRQLPMQSLRVEFCLLLGELREAHALVEQLDGAGGGSMNVIASQLHRLMGKHTRPIPTASPVHQIFVYRSLFNASLRMDAEDYAGADKLCRQALERVEEFQIWEPGIQAWLLRADLAARQGKPEEALALLNRAERAQNHPMCFSMNFITAARSVLNGQPLPDSVVSRFAQQGDYRSLAVLQGAGAPLLEGAARLLDDIHPHARRLAEQSFQPVTTSAALVVELDGQWFQAPGEDAVSLARYGSTRRILVALTEERLARPGNRLDADALIAAGWPGERILPLTAQTRLYTAIRKLRKLGLGRLLETASDGYRLAPHTMVSRVRGRIDETE